MSNKNQQPKKSIKNKEKKELTVTDRIAKYIVLGLLVTIIFLVILYHLQGE